MFYKYAFFLFFIVKYFAFNLILTLNKFFLFFTLKIKNTMFKKIFNSIQKFNYPLKKTAQVTFAFYTI